MIRRGCHGGKGLRASGPISRILSSRLRVIATRELRCRAQVRRRSFLWAADRSTARCSLPEGFARTPRSALTSNGPGRPSPPIWPCTARGLPCRGHCCPRGRLLPYRFTLTKWRVLKRSAKGLASGRSSIRVHRRFIFCGTIRSPTPLLALGPLALPGALPCGVRTFLQAFRFQDYPAIAQPARSVHYSV